MRHLELLFIYFCNFAATGGQVQMDSESLNLVMMDKEDDDGRGMGSNKDMGGGRSKEEEGG